MPKARLCSVPECGKPVASRDLCGAHYMRKKRNGHELAGGVTPGIPLKYFREVVVPHRGDDCLIWPYGKMGNGYAELYYDGRPRLAHRMACEAVHGPPPSKYYVAAHLCGNGAGGCVNPMHLKWTTQSQNCRHRALHGTSSKGAKNPMAKLSEDDARRIIDAPDDIPHSQLAAIFGVDRTTISQIKRGDRWKHLHKGTV